MNSLSSQPTMASLYTQKKSLSLRIAHKPPTMLQSPLRLPCDLSPCFLLVSLSSSHTDLGPQCLCSARDMLPSARTRLVPSLYSGLCSDIPKSIISTPCCHSLPKTLLHFSVQHLSALIFVIYAFVCCLSPSHPMH